LTALLLQADARRIPLADESVDAVFTSPPYWRLRGNRPGGVLGEESTIELYVDRLVGIFRELRRVLKPAGTVWLNLGDTIAGSVALNDLTSIAWLLAGRPWTCPSLKAGDLAGTPWRVALALQRDGWFLRGDVIWHNPNARPEPVTNRPSRSHEYVFLLAKSRDHYFAGAAIGPGTVWSIPCVGPANGFTPSPVSLVRLCILGGSREGDLVLDPFCGSGTTGVVAKAYGRRFVGMDLNRDRLRASQRRIERVRPVFASGWIPDL
jgi:DNA modification methylase